MDKKSRMRRSEIDPPMVVVIFDYTMIDQNKQTNKQEKTHTKNIHCMIPFI